MGMIYTGPKFVSDGARTRTQIIAGSALPAFC